MIGTQGPPTPDVALRHAAWFHELDAWTEYWDIYHPETHGRYYFGDGNGEPGLLTKLLPREQRPPVFVAWTQMALGIVDAQDFIEQVRVPDIASAVMEVDELVARLFDRHFGDPSDPVVIADYLDALFHCAIDSLPPATERDAKIADDDWRKPTAGRHMIESDLMWFAWAFHLEATHAIVGKDKNHQRRSLQLAGIATGCPANFAWRGHRRTRPEYHADESTAQLLRERGIQWASDFDASAAEIHTLFRIREWGQTD
jgi:hypothetical protein